MTEFVSAQNTQSEESLATSLTSSFLLFSVHHFRIAHTHTVIRLISIANWRASAFHSNAKSPIGECVFVRSFRSLRFFFAKSSFHRLVLYLFLFLRKICTCYTLLHRSFHFFDSFLPCRREKKFANENICQRGTKRDEHIENKKKRNRFRRREAMRDSRDTWKMHECWSIVRGDEKI